MKLVRLSPRGQLGDEIELPEQLAHHLAGIVALTQLLELPHDPRQGFFRLRDGAIGVVLALAFQALMMLEELFAEEIRKTLAGGLAHGALKT